MPNVYVVLRSDGDAWLLEWSTTLDAPLRPGVPVANADRRDGDVVQALRSATSAILPSGITISGEANIVVNRAGADETILTIKQIIEYYCCAQAGGVPPRGFDPRKHSKAETDEFISNQFAELKKASLDVPSDFS
jgi:flavin-dependent dehydrogenase